MKLSRILLLAGLVGIGILVLANLGDLSKFLLALRHFRWYVIILVIVIQLASYYCNARYYQTFFAISEYKVGLKRLFEVSLAINFTNQVVPSGGVAGTTYFAEALKPDVPAGMATLAQLGRYIFTFLSYFIVLGVGFLIFFLSDDSDLNKVSVRLAIILMLVVLAVGLVLLMIFSERSRLETTLKPFVRLVNAFGRLVLRRKRAFILPHWADQFLDEFYRGYHLVIGHKGRWPLLLAWSLAYNIAEVATIYVVFLGLGQWINPGIVVTGYTLAIIASFAGFLTGGIGLYELGMIGAFTALGVPFATAFTVVLVYRVLSMVLFLPPGFFFYRRHLLQSKTEVVA